MSGASPESKDPFAAHPSFSAFRASHVLRLDGTAAPAPWLADRDTFIRRIDERLRAWLNKEHFARLHLLAAAAESLGATPFVSTTDLAAIAAISAIPTSPSSHLPPHPSLRDLLTSAEPTPAARLRVFLAALRPLPADTATDDEIDELLDTVDISSPALRDLIAGLFALAAAGVDPAHRMRDELDGLLDGKKLKKRVDTARKALAAELDTFDTLDTSADPALAALHAEITTALAPLADGTSSTPSLPDLIALAARARVITDAQADVTPHARATAHLAIRRVLDAAAIVTELVARTTRAPAPAPPTREVRALLGAVNPLPRPEEELCVHLLDRQLTTRDRRDVPDPLDLTVADLCAHPELLALVPPLPAAALADPSQGIAAAVHDVDPLRATAALLAGNGDADAPPPSRVRASLVAARRDDLLAAFAAALPADERAFLADSRAARLARIRALSAQVGGTDGISAYHLVEEGRAELPLVEAWLALR